MKCPLSTHSGRKRPIADISGWPHQKLVKRKLLIAVLLALSAWLGWWARGFLAVDSCLDAGGRWEYRGGFCEGAPPVEG